MSSETITRNDLKNILDEVIPQASGDYMFVGSATGTTAVTLPNNWIDIVVVGKFGPNGVYGFTEFFIRKQLETYTDPNRFFGGNCTNSGNDYHGYWLQLSTTSVAMGGWNWTGTNYVSTSTIYVWARTGMAASGVATKTVTGTTDSNGNLSLGLTPTSAKAVISVYGSDFVYVPFVYSNNWYAKTMSSNSAHSAVTNQSVNVTITYLNY